MRKIGKMGVARGTHEGKATPLRAARHSLVRAWVREARESRRLYERSREVEGGPNPGLPGDLRRASWYATVRACKLAEQARAVRDADRLLAELERNPIRPGYDTTPECVSCEAQQPWSAWHDRKHNPGCTLARLVGVREARVCEAREA